MPIEYIYSVNLVSFEGSRSLGHQGIESLARSTFIIESSQQASNAYSGLAWASSAIDNDQAIQISGVNLCTGYSDYNSSEFVGGTVSGVEKVRLKMSIPRTHPHLVVLP